MKTRQHVEGEMQEEQTREALNAHWGTSVFG